MSWLRDSDGYTEVYVDGCYLDYTAGYGIYWGPNNPNNDSGRCRKDATNNTAEIHPAKFAIQQAKRLNIKKLRVYTDCNALFDAVNGNIAKWKANGWCSLYDWKPLPSRADYEDLDRVMQSVSIDIKFKLLQAHSGNQHHNEADRLARKGASS